MSRSTAIMTAILVGFIFVITSILILRISPLDASLLTGMFAGTIIAVSALVGVYFENRESNPATPKDIGIGLSLVIAVLLVLFIPFLQSSLPFTFYNFMNGCTITSLPIILFGMALLRAWLKI